MRHEWGPELWRAHVSRSIHLPIDPATRRQLEDYPRRVSPELVVEVLRSQMALDLQPQLGVVDVPTLVLHGERDAARPVRDARLLAGGIPDARLEVLNCGHTPPVERPTQTRRLVAQFLAELPVRGRPADPPRT